MKHGLLTSDMKGKRTLRVAEAALAGHLLDATDARKDYFTCHDPLGGHFGPPTHRSTQRNTQTQVERNKEREAERERERERERNTHTHT